MKTLVEIHHKIKDTRVFVELTILPREGESVFLTTTKGTISGVVNEIRHDINYISSEHYIQVIIK